MDGMGMGKIHWNGVGAGKIHEMGLGLGQFILTSVDSKYNNRKLFWTRKITSGDFCA